ncbi:hypothetical protein KIW84_063488 [Lathyrus oleraceus]|uniref:RRM domain-containing protein n=1 Tax=Pisum sativum TaxID=3888 RepID=A0A9D4W9Y5_PEA|nr:hypothetical protein KIW84_063488 [Pisum sativum]
MASVSGQQQFRYTQPPSKVLHLRNLPWECTEEELIELGKPFGKVMNTKCNVGSNRNQAFIEFTNLNQAIAMISYYASSSEPAQPLVLCIRLLLLRRQQELAANHDIYGILSRSSMLASLMPILAQNTPLNHARNPAAPHQVRRQTSTMLQIVPAGNQCLDVQNHNILQPIQHQSVHDQIGRACSKNRATTGINSRPHAKVNLKASTSNPLWLLILQQQKKAYNFVGKTGPSSASEGRISKFNTADIVSI